MILRIGKLEICLFVGLKGILEREVNNVLNSTIGNAFKQSIKNANTKSDDMDGASLTHKTMLGIVP